MLKAGYFPLQTVQQAVRIGPVIFAFESVCLFNDLLVYMNNFFFLGKILKQEIIFY